VIEEHHEADMSADIERGTGNVFADLGMRDAAERQTKTRLALAITDIIKARKLRQVSAATVLGIPQSKVSALMNYRLDGFSVERLMGFLTLLNRDVEIVIRPTCDEREGRVSVHALP
jgi:predicted XRE-type DNA-binding protein